MASTFVDIQGISKQFDDFVAVRSTDLTIQQGELFCLLGASGCGKSTLLRMLAGFETPSQGKIFIDGTDVTSIPSYKRPVNMMFQSYAIFPHMTVEQNIAFGLKQEKNSKAEIRKRVKDILELVEMPELAKRKPHQLSGGQRQRVALARILAKRPKLLLLDEPMAALDKKLREQMQLEVVDILESVNATCVMVTHDQEEAMTMASRIAIMHEGEILQVGTPNDIYELPNCRYTANFIGSVNLFEGKVIEDKADHVLIETAELKKPIFVDHGITGAAGMSVSVAVRPEKIILQREPLDTPYNCASGKVRDIAYLGSHSIYHVELENGKILLVHLSNLERGAGQPTWEETVYLNWHPHSAVVLTQ
ncbi:MAG: polyamine ABC transporter ATP-binding protein [SAR324 cluster bacterium]|jgi:putrescine transport system ATP-binding protein|nr:polyamine ABC transporter ATP-binding protein [SAR324 cluster bacterium]